MVSNKLKELEVARAKLARLEKSIAAERAELAALPARYGFATVAAFAKAVKDAAAGRTRRGRKGTAGKAAAAKGKGAAGRKRRKRAVITDETRTEVKKLVEAGKTGGEIAKQIGISLPSVQNIKKALGLVKNR